MIISRLREIATVCDGRTLYCDQGHKNTKQIHEANMQGVEDDDDQSEISVLLAAVLLHETDELAIEPTEDSGIMMPSLASINQESFFNGTNDKSFGSSFVSSFGASFAMGHKSETSKAKIIIEDSSLDLESNHRPPRRSSIQLDELQPRWDHSKRGVQRWDASPDKSYKKDLTPRIIRR
jgi:hypothetical protein